MSTPDHSMGLVVPDPRFSLSSYVSMVGITSKKKTFEGKMEKYTITKLQG